MNPLRRFGRSFLACALALLVACMAAACAPTDNPDGFYPYYQPVSPPPALLSGPLIGRRWHVESIRIPGVGNLVRPSIPAWVEFTPTGTVAYGTGFGDHNDGDCYPHTLAIEYDEGANTFRLINVYMVPASECRDQIMQGLLAEAIGNHWSIENDRLTLTGEGGSVMLLTLEAPL